MNEKDVEKLICRDTSTGLNIASTAGRTTMSTIFTTLSEKRNKHILHHLIHKFYNKFDQMYNQLLMIHIDYNPTQLEHFSITMNHLIDKKVVFHHKHNYLDNKLNHLNHNIHLLNKDNMNK